MKKIILFILVGLMMTTTFAADSDLDASFGTGGKVITGNSFNEGGRDVVIQPDGKIITVGAKTSNFNSGNMAVNRYNANGSLDSSFGTNGVFVQQLVAPEYSAGTAVAVALQSDGKILVAGNGRTLTSINAIFLLIRLNTNGTLDTTFGTNGRVFYDLGSNNAYGGLTSMAFDAERNKIYLGGTIAIDINSGIYGYGVVRFNGGNGALDTTYNGTGKQVFMIGDSRGIFTQLHDIALQSDGKIVATGGIQYLAPNQESIESFGTARINVDGTLDSTFGTNGIVITNYPGEFVFYSTIAQTVSLLPNGKIFVAGTGGTGSGGSIRNFYFAAQLNTDGSPDSAFGTGGKIRAEAIMIVDSVITQSGKIIVIGEKNANFGVARLNPNGTIDTTFGTGGFVQTGFSTGGTEYPIAVALQTDGKIVVSGGAKNPNTSGPGMDYTLIARYNGTAVSINNPALRIADFDGDGRTDASVFRNGTWFINPSSNPTAFAPQGFYGTQFGLATDKLAPADFDGDGKTDIAVWREASLAYFYILNSSNNTFRAAQFGQTGDNPIVVGDWDGDGKADPAVYRVVANGQSAFFYRPSSQPAIDFETIYWGTSGDEAVRGDFDGDGKLDAAVFRASNGVWYIRQSSNNQARFDAWGTAADKRVSGDFDGDGKTDLTVFRNGVWYIKQSSNTQPLYYNWGIGTDKIVAGDYDGDGKTDVAVWRDGIYYILQTINSQPAYRSFGTTGDLPVASAFTR